MWPGMTQFLMQRTEQTLLRPRITDLIVGSGQHITALVAPSGWGKTWAVAEAANNWAGEVVWITGNEEHADAAHFADELWGRLANGGHVPNRKTDLRHLEHLTDSLSAVDLLIVVDEAERVHPDALLALMRGALAPDSRFHLLFTLRRARYPTHDYPGVPLTSINLITAYELGFTREEVAVFAGETSPAYTRYDSHGGWPVAVAVLQEQGDDGQGLTGVIRHAIEELPGDLRDLVTRLAPASAWSEALAERVAGTPPKDWQRRLVQTALPVHYGGEGELRPHGLVREALLKDLRQTPAQYRLSLLAAADHALQRHETRTALEHLHNAQAWHQLARLLRGYLNDLAVNQRWHELVDVIDSLPLDKLPQPHRAYIKHVAGIALLSLARDLRSLNAAGYASQTSVEPGSRSDPAYLEAHGEQHIKRALEYDDTSQIAYAGRATLALRDDDQLTAINLAQAGWSMGPNDPVWHLAHGIALVYITMNVTGPAEAARIAGEVRQTVRYGRYPSEIVNTARALEYHFAGVDDPAEIERIRAHLKTGSSDPLSESDRLYLAAVSEAMLRQLRVHELLADLEAIRRQLTRPHPRSLQLIHRYRGIALLMDDQVDEGIHALKKAYTLSRSDAVVRSRTSAMYCLALTRAGLLDEAERELAEAEAPRAPYEHVDLTLQRAALARARRDLETGHALLAEVAPYAPTFTPFGKVVYATLKLDMHLASGYDFTEPVERLEALLAEHPTAAQHFWWLRGKRRLQRQLMEQCPGATRTIMGLTRALLGARESPHDQPAALHHHEDVSSRPN